MVSLNLLFQFYSVLEMYKGLIFLHVDEFGGKIFIVIYSLIFQFNFFANFIVNFLSLCDRLSLFPEREEKKI